jgi:hypothetical protein
MIWMMGAWAMGEESIQGIQWRRRISCVERMLFIGRSCDFVVVHTFVARF